MTSTTTTSNDTTEQATAAPETAQRDELVQLDPHSLDIDANVRDSVNTDTDEFRELVESIRQRGVLQPIVATRYADDVVKVTYGQRRTFAAREAGLETVPVIIRTDTASSDKERGFNRIVDQIEENDAREALTEGQRAAGIAEMLDLGISQTKIRKALRIKADQLKQAAKIGKSDTARSVLDSGQFDLEQAAIIGAFEAEGDADAVEQLMQAHRYNFPYIARQIIEDRTERKARAQSGQPYAEQGFEVLTVEPDLDYTTEQPYYLDEDLTTSDGEPVTVEQIEATPAAWAVWLELEKGGAITDRETGEAVEAEAIDWETESDTGIEPAEGLRHIDTVAIEDAWLPTFYTRDLAATGLQLSEAATALRAGGSSSASVSTDDGAGVTAAELAAAKQKEADRQARRQVRELNKLGDAALTVRREWLTGTLLARKTPPKDAAQFVAAALAGETGLLTQNKGAETAATLLGYDTVQKMRDAIATANAARAQVITLALVIGCYEARTTKDSWKRESWSTRSVPDYLHFLAANGHTLTDVEEVAAGDRDADSIPID